MTDSNKKTLFTELTPLTEGHASGLTRAQRAESAKVNILLSDLERNFHHMFFPEGSPRANH